ncbi:iron complex transport system substrate-binding protein [Oceanobacillus limi]|uniref:Iron complex transport system substrate-binding protein n=1 Tax=Oceanobacillus limi TaxID=930131 RepID=A0A1H9YIM3_9BACI|nr:cobalamin-binding protein [Oceanobacillus limi]SES68832.1 iron complex transport system substrate-binding protein [Oceanobacillus limi]
MRVVSLCPSNTEIMEYLGKTNLLVGVDNFSDFPQAVLDLPRVGPDLSIDMEKVASLKPDLVLASLSVPGMEKNIEGLEEKELPYITLDPNSLDEIADDIQQVGNAIHERELGEQKANEFRNEIHFHRKQASTFTSNPSLYWEWWPKPIFTPGGTNWLTEISELAGARNVYADHQMASVQTDWDDVKRKNPDHICMVWVGVKEEKMNPELVKKRPGWSNMDAIKEGNIHVLEESLYCRPSPRLLEGLRKLTALLTGEDR